MGAIQKGIGDDMVKRLLILFVLASPLIAQKSMMVKYRYGSTPPAGGAVTFGGGSGDSVTGAFNATGFWKSKAMNLSSVSNGYLIVAIGDAIVSPTDVRWKGTSLTRIDSTSRTTTSNHSEVWALKSPASGADSLTVIMPSNVIFTFHARHYYNVDQTTPLTQQASGHYAHHATGYSSSPALSSLVSGTDEYPIAFLSYYAAVNATDAQTNLSTYMNSSSFVSMLSSTNTPASSVNFSYTLASNQGWNVIAVSLNPAP